MKDWIAYFGLLKLRRLPNDHHYWQHRGSYKLLSPDVAMKFREFQDLAPWDKTTAAAVAFGWSARSAVVCGNSAARLHGLDVLGYDDPVELTYLGKQSPPGREYWPDGVIYRFTALPPSSVEAAHNLRVTNLVRTLRDVSVHHGVNAGVVAIDSARRIYPDIPLPALARQMLAGRPFKGIAQVRQALALSVPSSGSALESATRLRIIDAALPEIRSIELQVRFPAARDGRFYFVDILINGWLVLEVDGRRKYRSGAYGKTREETLIDERDREVWLQNLGLVVRRVGAKDLQADPGEECPLIVIVGSTLRAFPDGPTSRPQSA